MTRNGRPSNSYRTSGLDFTILKPAVIFGPGDDMVTHLGEDDPVCSGLSGVGRGDSILQPVHVQDVALAATRTLDRNQAVGKTYDVVGPTRMTLREVVGTVAEAIDLKLWIVNTPVAVQRIAVRLMGAVTPQSFVYAGSVADACRWPLWRPGAGRADLGIAPTPFTAEVVRELGLPSHRCSASACG